VLRYLSSSSTFLNLLARLLAHGTPRIQRLSLRLMRRLLPLTQNPDALQLSGLEHDGDAAATASGGSTAHGSGNVIPCLMHLLGHLLCAKSEEAGNATSTSATVGVQSSQAKADAAAAATVPKERYYRSAQVSFALASELIALMRILYATPAWNRSIQAALIAAITPVPQLLQRVSSVSDSTPGLQLAIASLAVLGGQREVLRVGGKVEVFHSKTRRKRKIATLLAYDPLAATASVAYDSVATKSVQVLARGMCIAATEEIEFDAQGLNLLDESTRPILNAMRAALEQILTPTTVDPSVADAAASALPTVDESQGPSLSLAPPTASVLSLAPPSASSGGSGGRGARTEVDDAAAAGSGSLLGLAPPGATPSLSLSPSSVLGAVPPSLSAMPRREHSASVPAPVAATPLVLVQLRSRAIRALWNLLGSRSNVHACIRAGFGPILTRVSQLQTSIPISDVSPAGRLEEVERLTDRFAEMCQDRGLLYTKPKLVETGAAFAEQALTVPFNPYKSMVRLPIKMQSDDPLMVIEDAAEASCQLVTTGRTQAWEDEVPAWGDCPFPEDCPSSFFEVTIMNRCPDGIISVGLAPAGKKVIGFPGQSRTPGSFGLFDNGYWQIDRTSHDVNWPPGASESTRYWVDGDVIGILHNRLTGFVSVSHNGILKEDVVRLPSTKRFVPAVCVGAAGMRLYVNFGQHAFRYPFATSKFVPTSLGGSMSADAHDADEEEAAADSASTAVASASSGGRRTGGLPGERATGKPTSAAAADNDPVAAKKKALLDAEEADKKRAEQEAAAAKGEEEKKAEEDPAVAGSSGATGAAGSSAESKENEEKTEEKSAEDISAARRRDVRASMGESAAAGESGAAATSDDRFDAWKDEDDFEEGAGGGGDDDEGGEEEEGDASTDEDDDAANDNNEEWDEYGQSTSRKKARLPPLTIDALEIGMVVAIKPSKPTSDAEKKAAKKAARLARRNGTGQKDAGKKARAAEKLVGRVVQIAQAKRSVLLSCYQSENGLAHTSWFPIASITRLKPRVNGDLYAAADKEKAADLLQTTLEHEACLASCYARSALLTIISHSFQRNSKTDDKQLAAATASSLPSSSLDEQDVELSLDDVGGAEAVCAAVKRAALDLAREGNSKAMVGGADDEDGSTGGNGGGGDAASSARPGDVFRRFLLGLLRSGDEADLASLLRREAISGLSAGSNASLSWVERIKSKEFVSFGMQLVDLLLAVQQRAKPTAAETFTKNALQRLQQEQQQQAPATFASASASASPVHSDRLVSCPVYSIEVYDALVALLLPSKKLKVFKPTSVDTSVYLLLARLISQLDRFEDERMPDLSKLDWLAERMTARHAVEVKHLGAEAAVSKPLQTIINLVLAKNQAESKLKARATTPASGATLLSASSPSLSLTPPSALSSSPAPFDDDDPTNIGPEQSSLSWFDVTKQTWELMTAIQSGAGVPAWFIRLAWLDVQIQKQSIVREGEHPYQHDAKWSEIMIPDAQSLTIRLDAKSKSDASDKLRFAMLATGSSSTGTPVTASGSGGVAQTIATSSGPVLETALVEVASFSGGDMSKSGTGSLVKAGQSVELKGESRVFWSFTQSPSPVHPNVFCAACDFPIKVRHSHTHTHSGTHTHTRTHTPPRTGRHTSILLLPSPFPTSLHDRQHDELFLCSERSQFVLDSFVPSSTLFSPTVLCCATPCAAVPPSLTSYRSSSFCCVLFL
jgi:hypothetical protein